MCQTGIINWYSKDLKSFECYYNVFVYLMNANKHNQIRVPRKLFLVKVFILESNKDIIINQLKFLNSDNVPKRSKQNIS